MEGKLIVIAIGGNSLIEDPKKVTVDAQYRAAEKTARHIAKIIADGNRVVIVHGNDMRPAFSGWPHVVSVSAVAVSIIRYVVQGLHMVASLRAEQNL